jgi:hypothetical protein
VIVTADLNAAADGMSRDVDELLAAGWFGAIVLTVIFGPARRVSAGDACPTVARGRAVDDLAGPRLPVGRVLRHGMVRAAERPRDARAVRPDHARPGPCSCWPSRGPGRQVLSSQRSAGSGRGPPSVFSLSGKCARVCHGTESASCQLGKGRRLSSRRNLPVARDPLHGSASRTQRYALGLTCAKIRKLGSPSGSSWNSGLTHPRSSSRPS